MSGRERHNKPKDRGSLNLADPPRQEQTAQISFNLQHLSAEYGFTHVSFKEKHYENFCKALCDISAKTWAQAISADKHSRIGTERFPINQFNKRLMPPSQFSKETEAIVFRYHENRSMLGFREGHVFYIVWIEAEYGELYIHSMKERQNRK